MRLSGFVRGALVLACVGMLLTGAQAGSGTARPSTPARAGAASGVAATEPLRIMPLGASSTVGTGSASTAGYRGPLQQRMAAHGIAVELVGSQQDGPASVPDRDHEGHGGWTLARMAPQVAGWVRDARPDVVLLHAGTNDLIQGASAQVAAQRLDVVLDAIHEASDAHVIVAGIWAPLPARAAGPRRVRRAGRGRGRRAPGERPIGQLRRHLGAAHPHGSRGRAAPQRRGLPAHRRDVGGADQGCRGDEP